MTDNKAIVIGIDGAQLEKLEETPTPNLDSLNFIESFTGGIQGTETEQETFSGTGWGTLLTGVWANKHGIISNDDTLRANPEFPSIFEYVHNDNPDNFIASVVNWGPINAYFEEDVETIVDFELTAPEPTDDNLAQDNIIAPTVADLILEEAPDYTFVHLDNVDVVGHDLGFSPEYLDAITTADGHVGTILDAVEAREEAYSNEDWLFLVTTDHGRELPEGFDHGGQTDSERTTFIASNKALDDSEAAPATDVVPTVLDHLEIEGGNFDGKSLLVGEALIDNLTSLDKNSEWELKSDEVVDFFTYHPQGMTKIDDETLFLSSVEIITPTEKFDQPRNGLDRTPGEGEGHLFKFDTEGNLIDSITLGDGDIYHPGGIDYDGEYVWVPVAEYRPDSESIIYRVDPETMDKTEAFRFPDHIGGVLHNPDTNTLHGVSWGSRRFYTWHLDENLDVVDADQDPESLLTPNSSYYIDYQDGEYVGDNLGLFSGLQTYQDAETEEPLELGGLELVDLTTNKPVFQVPVSLWTEANADETELVMTHNPVYVEPTETGLKAYFMPEDDTSRLFVYEVEGEEGLPTPRSEALPNTHAHNDYEHENSLFDALSNGFVSVEADIWLYPDDGENLRVAHDPVEDPTTLPTLEELYLDPLQELNEEFDNGGVYADGTPLTLLIDLKSEGLPTYQQLDEVLAEYQAETPGLFTTYAQDEMGNYTVTPGAVTPIISGDRPREYMESQEVRYAGYDGRKDDIGTDVDPGFMPLISDNWDNFFTGDLAWDGTGTIPEDTEAELNEIVAEVQEEDKMLRFWNLPQDAPSVWEPLYEAGVDLINTDDLEELSTFIESQLNSEVEPVNQILEIWEDATIDYTSVVAHRGGYYENGVTTIPENSFTAIEQSIDLGVEMIELDVWKTEDDRYVIIHDETVDRTTTGSGRVEDLTLDELKELNLIIEDTGEVTSEKIPTLEEAFKAVDGEIMLNIDIKLPVEELVNVMNVARDMDVDEQIVIKNPVNNEEQFEAVQETISQLPFSVKFMPIFDDSLVSDPEFVEEVFEEFQPDAAEMLVRPQGEEQKPVEDPGFLFSEEVKEIAQEYDVRLWINTLFANPEIDDNGFRNDVLALTEPDEVFGFWVDAGASVLQTDEPLLAIDYLSDNGLRDLLQDETPVFGTVNGDILEIEGSNQLVFAGEGDDLSDASAASGSNRLYGDGGDDTFILGTGDRLVGGDGDDRFFAQTGGENTITGGEGEDQFWIAVTEIPEGVNTITDFKAGTDVLGIAGFDADFGQLDISGQNGSEVIAFDGNDLAYLDGIEANSLTAADFAFA